MTRTHLDGTSAASSALWLTKMFRIRFFSINGSFCSYPAEKKKVRSQTSEMSPLHLCFHYCRGSKAESWLQRGSACPDHLWHGRKYLKEPFLTQLSFKVCAWLRLVALALTSAFLEFFFFSTSHERAQFKESKGRVKPDEC